MPASPPRTRHAGGMDIDRRRFLSVATATGVAGLAAAGCDGSGGGTGRTATPSATRSTPPGSPGHADWSALADGLAGELIRTGEPHYRLARQNFDPTFDHIRPAAIAYCHHGHDVAECLRFARRYHLPVTPRCGGHSYLGTSLGPGLVIDVGPMARVRADRASGTAAVGAGARLVDVYTALATHGVSIPAGSCPTVGIAGLALGGGLGVVGRAYGTTSDNLRAVDIVTTDGRRRHCDRHHDPDLFWACRGGGGGTFGIATEFTFATHPAADIVLFFLRWPWSRAHAVLDAWQHWAPHAPDELWSNLHLLGSAADGTTVQVGGTYLGDRGTADTLLDRLVARVKAEPASRTAQTSGYQHAMLLEAGCARRSVAQCHLPGPLPGRTGAGELHRVRQDAASHILTRPLPAAGIDAVLSAVARRAALAGGGEGGAAFDALGGAINRVAPGDTAFVHRDGLCTVQLTTNWTGSATRHQVHAQRSWLHALHRALGRHASGQAYQNYADATLTDWKRAYFGADYPRLLTIKHRYDPDRLLDLPQTVGAH